jgi:hypothetical protein
MFRTGAAATPRGGTTSGQPVTQARDPHPGWLALTQSTGLALERDRLAILAMAGTYRSEFEFLETVAFVPNYRFDQPYRSWATEVVLVAENSERRIQLQHVLVMSFVDDEGHVQGPLVTKHWRQEWVYEDTELFTFVGHDTWQRRQVTPEVARGKWSQAVYQVDDSPRYEALGRWQHLPNTSLWTSEETWRPLPRREHSVRADYQVLIGTNRHAITPQGWTQEEDNLKAVLGRTGVARVLAREIGLNRYVRLASFDAEPAQRYWSATAPYWRAVRDSWGDVYGSAERFSIAPAIGGKPLFMEHFEFAERLTSSKASPSADAMLRHARDTLGRYVRVVARRAP